MKNQHRNRTLKQLEVELRKCMSHYLSDTSNSPQWNMLGRHIRSLQDTMIKKFKKELTSNNLFMITKDNVPNNLVEHMVQKYKKTISINAFK